MCSFLDLEFSFEYPYLEITFEDHQDDSQAFKKILIFQSLKLDLKQFPPKKTS